LVGSKHAKRIAGGAALALAGGGLSFVLSIAYQVVIARRLGPGGFGVLVLALAISNLLAEASDLGLDYGVLRFGSIAHRSGEPGRFRSVLGPALRGSALAGIAGGAALAAGAAVVAHLFNKPTLGPVLVPLAISVPFTGTTEVARAGLRAMGNAARPVASSSVIAPSVRLATGVWAIVLVPSAQAMAWAYMATEATVLVITLVMLWQLVPRTHERAARWKGLFSFSLPMSLNRVLLYSNNQTEILVLGILAPTVTVGIFGVARRLSVLLGALLASVSILFNPMVADFHHSGRMQELDHVFKTVTRWLLTLGLPVCLVEVLFGSDILRVFGKEFSHGAVALAILALGQLVNVGTGTVSNLQAMAGYAKLTLLNSLLFLSLSIALDLLLIPSFGLLGAAIANSSSLTAVNLLRIWQIRRNLGLVPYDRSFLRPIAAAVPASLVAWLLPLSHLPNVASLAVRVSVLGAVYAGALFLFGFEQVDREIARAALARLRGRRADSPPIDSSAYE